MPIDKLQFSTGDNQAENFTRLIKHLATKAQGKYGAPMAYILLNGEEYTFDKPTTKE